MLKLRTLLVASIAVMFAQVAGAQTVSTTVTATPGTTVVIPASGTATVTSTPAVVAPAAQTSSDPYVQKRIADKEAKKEYKARKKVAKKEYKADKKEAKSEMKAEKREAAQERKEQLAIDPAVAPK